MHEDLESMKVQVCRHEVEAWSLRDHTRQIFQDFKSAPPNLLVPLLRTQGICRDQVGDALLHNESQQSLAAWLCVALLPFCTSARKVCGRPAWYGMVSMPSSAMSYD